MTIKILSLSENLHNSQTPQKVEPKIKTMENKKEKIRTLETLQKIPEIKNEYKKETYQRNIQRNDPQMSFQLEKFH